MVFPKFDFHGNSVGEDDIWDKMRQYLPQNYVSFHNYLLDTQEVDWILLVPDFGVLIIEIKAFYPNNIVIAIDNNNILLSDGTMEYSPYKQAQRYWKKLLEMTADNPDLKKVYIARAACFPFLTRKDIADKKLTRICADKLIISKEDLVNFSSLSLRIETIFRTTYEVSLPGALDYGFNEEIKKEYANFISDGCMDENDDEIIQEDEVKEADYSIICVKTKKIDEGKIDKLFNSWKHGTKIFFFTKVREDAELLRNKICEYIKSIGELDRLCSKGDIFNCYIDS